VISSRYLSPDRADICHPWSAFFWFSGIIWFKGAGPLFHSKGRGDDPSSQRNLGLLEEQAA
jgi:hypothetical protein